MTHRQTSVFPVTALLNVCSIKKVNSTNKKACSLLLQDLDKHKIEVCLVTETFLRPSVPDSFVAIDGFQVFRRDRRICQCRRDICDQPHGGGGVLIYAKTCFQCDVYEISSTVESLWIKLSTIHNAEHMFLNVTYHPPGSNPTPTLDYLSQSLTRITQAYPRSYITIGGDFNRISLVDLEVPFCLTILDSPPTRAAATLDLLLTNRPDLVLETSCFDPILQTDHRAVLLKPRHRIPPTRTQVHFIDYNRRGSAKLSRIIDSTSFTDIFLTEDVHDAAFLLDAKIENCVKEAFPRRTVTMSDRDPAWITPKVKWLLQQKKRAKARGNHQTSDLLEERLGMMKMKFLNKNQSSQFWNKVDTITHRKYSNKTISHKDFDPIALNSELAKRSTLPHGRQRLDPPSFNTAGILPPSLSLSEVANCLKYCKKTASGPTSIPSFVFRDLWDVLSPLYLHVWNLSIAEGTFPRCYKLANLVPIPKINKATKSEDLRGISITPISARLFEKCVHRKWIQPQVERVGDVHQFAYKSKLSTVDCLLTLQHYILNCLDQRAFDGVHLLMLDFSKAFDTVDQELAASSFPNFVTSPFICQWLYSFIIDRHQRLIWKGEPPQDFVKIDLGCSQGTVGGPSIFSMFTDDIRAKNPNTTILKYSDDANALVPCPSPAVNDKRTTLREEIDHIQETASRKRLTINKDKTKIIRFSINRNQANCNCVYDRTKYNEVSNSKILGIHFDSNCRFSTHWNVLSANLKRTLFILRDLQLSGAKQKEIDKVFEALILSRIRYGLPVYGSDHTVMGQIDHFLHRCYQKGFTSSTMSAEELLNREDQRILASILSNPLHPLLPFLTSCPTQNNMTRQSYTQLKPCTRTKFFSSAFCNRVRPF